MSPRLVVLFGPPAVGKMAVGQALAEATGLRLFHNHMSIEPVLGVFDFGSPAFARIVGSLRRQVAAEVAASDLPGLIFTFVWDLDSASDAAFLEEICGHFDAGRVCLVELQASQATRLARNRHPDRLAAKASKRNIERSAASLVALDGKHRLASSGPLPLDYPHLVIDNESLSVAEAAQRIARWIDA